MHRARMHPPPSGPLSRPLSLSLFTLLSLSLSLSLSLLLGVSSTDASPSTWPKSLRRLQERLNGDDDEGTPSSPTPSTSSCSVTFQGTTRTFNNCVNLDATGTHKLAWQKKTSPSGSQSTSTPTTFEVFYQGVPANPYGWAGWGISPTGKMWGSYVAVGYGDAQNTSFAAANLYSIPDYPTVISLTQSDSLLRVLSPSLPAEVTESGTVVRSLADVSITGAESGPVYVIWGGGPSADASTGALVPHMGTVGTLQLDFTRTTGSTTGSSSPPAAGSPGEGSPASPPPVSLPPAAGGDSTAGSNCLYSFKGESQTFTNCMTLDSSRDIAIAWTPKANTSPLQYTVLFQGVPEAAYGWAAWGVSPTGLMQGSYVITGYGDSASSAQAGARLYKISGFQPQVIATNGTIADNSGLLGIASSSIAVEVATGGGVVRTLADVIVPSGTIYVIWGGGPSAVASTGMLTKHGDTWTGSTTLDFAGGVTSGAAVVTSRFDQKIIHAWLAGIGYGVLMPAGILIARHLKVWADPLWFYAHIGTQLVGYILGAIGFGFGIWLRTQFPDWGVASELQVQHFGIGIAIFCTSTLQILTPSVKPFKEHKSRLYWNLVHWFLGYSTVILSFVNIFFGFQIMGAQRISTAPWRTVYIIFLCVWGALLILLEPLSWHMYLKKQRAEQASRHVPEKDANDSAAELENGKSNALQ